MDIIQKYRWIRSVHNDVVYSMCRWFENENEIIGFRFEVAPLIMHKVFWINMTLPKVSSSRSVFNTKKGRQFFFLVIQSIFQLFICMRCRVAEFSLRNMFNNPFSIKYYIISNWINLWAALLTACIDPITNDLEFKL